MNFDMLDKNQTEILSKKNCDQLDTRLNRKWQNGVLIGNWFEERLCYQRLRNSTGISETSSSYQPFKNIDDSQNRARRINRLAFEFNFFPKEYTKHHGDAYMNNLITTSDQDYGGRKRADFPERRRWKTSDKIWVPEKTDFPIMGEPTNWGLRDQILNPQKNVPYVPDYESTYMAAYWKVPPKSSYNQLRYACPSSRSFTYNKSNKINRDAGFPVGPWPEILKYEKIHA